MSNIVSRKLDNAFPVPLAQATFNDDALFQAASDAILAMFKAELPINNRLNALTTPDDLHEREAFGSLRALIDVEIRNYLKNVYTMDPDDCVLTGMWSNVSNASASHHIHVHPNAFLSGVIYLNVPEGSGDVFFVRPGFDMYRPNHEKWHPYLARSMHLSPFRGLMLLFPSYLPHGTEPGTQREGEYRISLSFNYALKRSNYHTGKLAF